MRSSGRSNIRSDSITMSALVVMGELVERGQIGFCEMGANHSELVRDIREERMRRGFNINESCALCLRCGKAVPLTLK
jgi:hypothetical protein